MFSFELCTPKRPPLSQKLPDDPGTPQLATLIGCFSEVMSTNQASSRAWFLHSFCVCSLEMTTKLRNLPTLSLANSAIGMLRIGKAVCAPLKGLRYISPTTG